MRTQRLLSLVLAVMLLSLISVSFAKPTSSVLNVSIDWIIDSSIILDEADLEVFIPSNSSNQKILSMQFSDEPEILINGSIWKAKFQFNDIESRKVTGNFIIETDYLNRERIDDQNEAYLRNTTNVIVDASIEEITSNFSKLLFPYNAIEAMSWVHDNIKYDIDYTDIDISDVVEVTLPSNVVLDKRAGVCDEFSTLYLAFMRSMGYQSRIIVGYVSTDNQWIPHAWTEIYVPKYGWVEVDPTHDQFMNLNAMRFRTATAADSSEIADRISAKARSEGSVALRSFVNITVISSNESTGVTTDVSFPTEPEFNPTQAIVLRTKNLVSDPIYTSALIIPPAGVDCKSCSSNVFLEPNEESTDAFILELPRLAPNTRYEFPTLIVTDYGRQNASFERLVIEQSIEDKYQTVDALPLDFKLFVGLFIIGAIALIVIVILSRW